MWFRFIGISLLKWVADTVAIMLVLGYVVPHSWHGYALSFPIWIMTTALAYGFAYWALHPSYPTQKNVIILLIVWMVITFMFEASYEVFIIGVPILFSNIDTIVQYMLEIAAILMVARVLRIKKMHSAAGEGIAV